MAREARQQAQLKAVDTRDIDWLATLLSASERPDLLVKGWAGGVGVNPDASALPSLAQRAAQLRLDAGLKVDAPLG